MGAGLAIGCVVVDVNGPVEAPPVDELAADLVAVAAGGVELAAGGVGEALQVLGARQPGHPRGASRPRDAHLGGEDRRDFTSPPGSVCLHPELGR